MSVEPAQRLREVIEEMEQIKGAVDDFHRLSLLPQYQDHTSFQASWDQVVARWWNLAEEAENITAASPDLPQAKLLEHAIDSFISLDALDSVLH